MHSAVFWCVKINVDSDEVIILSAIMVLSIYIVSIGISNVSVIILDAMNSLCVCSAICPKQILKRDHQNKTWLSNKIIRTRLIIYFAITSNYTIGFYDITMTVKKRLVSYNWTYCFIDLQTWTWLFLSRIIAKVVSRHRIRTIVFMMTSGERISDVFINTFTVTNT